ENSPDVAVDGGALLGLQHDVRVLARLGGAHNARACVLTHVQNGDRAGAAAGVDVRPGWEVLNPRGDRDDRLCASRGARFDGPRDVPAREHDDLAGAGGQVASAVAAVVELARDPTRAGYAGVLLRSERARGLAYRADRERDPRG